MTVLVRHDMGCPLRTKGVGHSDAAKRLYDTYHLHRSADYYNALGKWFASALADGQTDSVLYDSKRDAVRHQHHNEFFYTYIQITPGNMSICNAEVMLSLARRLYDKGMRMADPNDRSGGREVIKRSTVEDQLAMVRLRPTNLIIPGITKE